MLNLSSKLLGGVAVAIVASAVSAPAQAQTVLYSGGGTLAEKVYRDIFNCYGGTDGGAFSAKLVGAPTGCNAATPYRPGVLQSYVGVGSGNGKAAFRTHDASHFTDGNKKADNPPVAASGTTGPLYGTGTGNAWVPNSDDSGPFPSKVSFVGSDDPLLPSDLVAYFATSGGTDLAHPGNFGAPIQVPGLVTAVAVPFHQTATWTEKNKAPSGGSSGVMLSTDNLCGIFTGAITDWSDNAFKVDNKNVQLGNGPITVVYRGDSSGTTFLFSNALINQCAGTAHPIPASWQSAAGNGAGVGNNSFFINVKTAGLLPANFVAASGSGAVKSTVHATVGAVGYLSPDFVLPIDTTDSDKAANLQVFDTNPASPRYITGLKAKFLAPTGKNATNIVAKLKPPVNKQPNAKTGLGGSCPVGNDVNQAPDGNCAHNPLNWGVTAPAPVGTAAYPIGGFTFLDAYTCYATDADAMAGTTVGSFGLLRWYFGSTAENATHVKTELMANGFGVIPGAWLSGVKKLISTDKLSKISPANTGNCVGKSGA
jgi:ABC-type phosphate transport system substrate-binding protein